MVTCAHWTPRHDGDDMSGKSRHMTNVVVGAKLLAADGAGAGDDGGGEA